MGTVGGVASDLSPSSPCIAPPVHLKCIRLVSSMLFASKGERGDRKLQRKEYQHESECPQVSDGIVEEEVPLRISNGKVRL